MIKKKDIVKFKERLLWQLGYKPLKEKKVESIVATIKKSIRTRKSRKLEAEIENIMFECGLYNNKSGEYAMHLNTDKKTPNHFITVWKIPRGLEFRNYKVQQRKFADGLTAQVNIKMDNGALVIEVIKGVIPKIIKYKFNANEYIGKEYQKGKFYILPIPLGHDQSGLRIWDLAKVYHILISGVIGGGKSVLMKCMVDALLQNDNVLIFVIDLAMVDLFHTRHNVIFGSDLDDAEEIIKYVYTINETRRHILVDNDCVDILEFNEKSQNIMKHIVLFIDEAAFTSPEMSTDKATKNRRKKLQNMIAQVIATSRKTGIHMILGLQRPEKDVMPMIIKSQIPGKIAFRTENVGTSRTILGTDDAFYLPEDEGRMLVSYGGKQHQVQGMWLDPDAAKRRVKTLPVRRDKDFEYQRDEDQEEGLLPR